MRKPLIIFALFAATVFGAGYLIGQLRGVSTGSAASLNPAQSQAPMIQWGGLRDSFRSNDPGTSSGPHVDGVVTAVNGDTVTIKPDGATNANNETETVTTITLTGSTQYGAGASASSGKSSITVGSFVIAEGTVRADGKSLAATNVDVRPSGAPHGGPGGFGGGPHVDGTVTGVGSDSVTIKPDATHPSEQESVTTITLTTSTQYGVPPDGSGATANKDSIKVGSYVIAIGTVSSAGKTLTATRVDVLPSAPTGNLRPFGQFGGPFGRGDGSLGGGNGPFGGANDPFNQTGAQPGTNA
jgi:hypothetical protein